MKRRHGETETGRHGENLRFPDSPIPRFDSSPLPRFPDSKKAGFTLIELIIVLIILGTISVIAFPRMENFISGGGLKSSSRRLAGTIRYLHDRSATTARCCRLYYNLDKDEYWIAERNEEGEFAESRSIMGKREALAEGVSFLDIVTPQGKINSGQTYTQFFPRGSVTGTIIHLQDEKDKVQTLLVRDLTAKVEIYEGYVEEEESE